jgi:hypothetical protein
MGAKQGHQHVSQIKKKKFDLTHRMQSEWTERTARRPHHHASYPARVPQTILRLILFFPFDFNIRQLHLFAMK